VKGPSEGPIETLAQFGDAVNTDIRDRSAIVRAGNTKAD
jgi:hypothetical protein